MKKTCFSLAALALAACAVLPASAQQAVAVPSGPGVSMLVLDASGSMWGQIKGRAKIEIAREAVGSMLKTWPRNQQLGLMAYGHRSKGNCADIEVLKAPAVVDAAAMQQAVNALQPKGMTPISASVRMAAEQLKFSERKATVILVSDGEETCHADPCALGAELEKLGVDFTAHVIGFDIQNGSKAQAQLQCLASATGGRYIDARDAGELNKALGEVAKAPATPTPPPAKTASYDFGEGCMLYDAENFKGATYKIESGTRNDAMPDGWSKRVKSLACAANCGLLGFADPGYDGKQLHVDEGARWARMPEDYSGSFGSFDSGCRAVLKE